MSLSKEQIEQRIAEIETQMSQPDFWSNKDQAQKTIKEYEELKDAREGVGKYDRGNAIMTLFAGAGGDDAEDFVRMLLEMYLKYCESKNWTINFLYENKSSHGGYRTITFEIAGKKVYGTLKHESGVHRLVRISPFNAKGLRQTSFAMVEVIPDFEKQSDFKIPETELSFEYSRSSGPGGQNVNKRETAVRVVHQPTGLAVHMDSERSQLQNKERALEILAGKLYTRMEEERKQKESGLYVSKTTDAEWGSQIRSYVLHPYKLIKDHRTEVEVRNVESVLDGDLEPFITAELEKFQ